MARPFVIRCPLHGSIQLTAEEKKLLDHRFFQRLRWISQLGLGNLVYPGAVHSRFSHSLGVLMLAEQFFDQLTKLTPLLSDLIGSKMVKDLRRVLRLTALLHDIGHMPFSHCLEDLFPNAEQLDYFDGSTSGKVDHEDFSVLMIKQLVKENQLDQDTADSVIALITGELPETNNFFVSDDGLDTFGMMLGLINSELDIDRMDYLLRDAAFCGVAYGQYDTNHINRSLGYYADDNSNRINLMLREDGISAFEDLLLSRRLMFAQVYFHKTLLVFTTILKQAILAGELKINLWDSLDNYVACNDNKLLVAIEENREKYWCNMLYSRKPLKTLVRYLELDENKKKISSQLCEQLQAEGIKYYIAERNARFYRSTSSYTLLVLTKNMGHQQVKTLDEVLNNVYDDLQVWQLNIFHQDLAKALKITKQYLD